MSHSPRDGNDPDQLFQYRRAWAAINTMLEQGRSLSGYERHCAFLNTGGQRFADISAASGLDLLDDGRGVALADWDHDGRMDLWTTNRTAPWVRLLKNFSSNKHHFVSVKLEGVHCNRDAIGARLKLKLGGEHPRSMYRSLRAGEGFVAQSTKWIVFGLGDNSEIESLFVRWPSGEVQEFKGLDADQHWRIVQGDASPRAWSPPEVTIDEKPSPPKTRDGSARIVLANRVPIPELPYRTIDGEAVEVTSSVVRPVLINLWASWCAPCMVELNDWNAEAEQLNAAVQVVALNVDGLDEGADREGAKAAAKNLQGKSSFQIGLATNDTVDLLSIAADALVDKPQPLVVPASFLLDKEGRIAVIYRGSVSVDQLLDDVKNIHSTPEDCRNLAAHFPGRWFDSTLPSDPAVLLKNLLARGRLDSADKYLRDWLARQGKGAERPAVESLYLVADAHRQAGDLESAAESYKQALAVDPSQPRVNLDLAICLMNLRRSNEAIPFLENSLAGDPQNDDTRKRLILACSQLKAYPKMEEHARLLVWRNSQDVVARLHLAYALKKQSKYVEALSEYRTSAEQQPDSLLAMNDLAWLLATCPADEIRDGRAALEIAQAACSATNYKHPALLDTLAAAQAAVAQFDQAIETLQTAIELSKAAGESRLEAVLKEHLAMYENGEPLRES